jgi:hypothetical protein
MLGRVAWLIHQHIDPWYIGTEFVVLCLQLFPHQSENRLQYAWCGHETLD